MTWCAKTRTARINARNVLPNNPTIHMIYSAVRLESPLGTDLSDLIIRNEPNIILFQYLVQV